jgi:hypothetical protein
MIYEYGNDIIHAISESLDARQQARKEKKNVRRKNQRLHQEKGKVN